MRPKSVALLGTCLVFIQATYSAPSAFLPDDNRAFIVARALDAVRPEGAAASRVLFAKGDAFEVNFVGPNEPEGRTVRLSRRHLGLRVISNDTILQIGQDGQVKKVYEAGLNAPITISDITPGAPASVAEGFALQHFGHPGIRLLESAKLVILALKAAPRLAWEMRLSTAGGDISSFLVYVSDDGQSILDKFTDESAPIIPPGSRSSGGTTPSPIS